MADNIDLGNTTGKIVRTEDISGIQFPVSKMILGAANVDDGPVSAANPVPTGSFAQSFVAGQTSVGVSAVQVQSSSQVCRHGVQVKANMGNTGIIYVGHSSGVTTSNGYELGPGESVFVPIDNVNKVYVISDTASQGISWLAI